MNTKETIVVCSFIVMFGLSLWLLSVVTGLKSITETLSKPGIVDTMKIESLSYSDQSGNRFELKNVEVTADSRMIDIFLGAAISEQNGY